MNEKRQEMRMLYQLLSPSKEVDRTDTPLPSLLPWLGYALLGLVTVIILVAGVQMLLRIG